MPDTTSVEFGSTIFMTCVADYGDGNETTFSWSLNGITIDNNSANGFIISDTNVSRNDMTFMMSTLQVCSMGIDDVGQYSCTASNSAGNDTAAWNITIADSEEAELLVVSDSIILSRFGDTVSMACAASGFPPPRIAFHKDGVNINDAGSDFITVNHTTITGTTGINYTLSTVQICNVGVNEIGLYSCTASNGVGSPHTLCWSFTPELSSLDIVTSPIDQVVEFSSTVNMTCVVNGYPFPKVVFSKDGETVDTNGATITEGVVIDQISRMASYQSVLTVYNIRQNELGIYSCTATNDHGTNSVSWNIMFPRVSNPAELIIVPDKVHSVEYGSTVLIPCVHVGYPQSELLFSKNDTPIIDSMSENVSVYQRTISLHGINCTLSILEICSIRIDDIGEYACTVSNALGNQSYSWSIVFTRDPEPTEILIVPSKNHSVDHGSTIILGCVAYGLPLPEIFWLRDDTLLTTSASNLLTINREILTEEGIELKRSFLEVCGLSEEDSGMYTCQAINSLATKTFDFELDVLPGDKSIGVVVCLCTCVRVHV